MYAVPRPWKKPWYLDDERIYFIIIILFTTSLPSMALPHRFSEESILFGLHPTAPSKEAPSFITSSFHLVGRPSYAALSGAWYSLEHLSIWVCVFVYYLLILMYTGTALRRLDSFSTSLYLFSCLRVRHAREGDVRLFDYIAGGDRYRRTCLLEVFALWTTEN